MNEPGILIYSPFLWKDRCIDEKIARMEAEHSKRRFSRVLPSETARIIPTDEPAAPPAYTAKKEKAVSPFKEDQLERICAHLKQFHLLRDLMLFVLGVNLGLRYSDLCKLRFSDFMDSTGHFFDQIPPRLETKTAKKHKSNRHIYINDAVREVITLYLRYHDCTVNDFLFPSVRDKNKPMSRKYMDKIIKHSAYHAGIQGKFGTHSFRKTFGYRYMAAHQDDPNALCKLQRIFGHSSPSVTLAYIGITEEDIREAYNMNLGMPAAARKN